MDRILKGLIVFALCSVRVKIFNETEFNETKVEVYKK